MRNVFILLNVAIVCGIIYIFFGPMGSLTGHVVLENGLDTVIVGSVLHYNVKDLDTGNLVTKDYITEQEVFLVREGDEINDFSKLKVIETWTTTEDADDDGERCDRRGYLNKKYFYDMNGNGERDEGDFTLYSVLVDEKGCFNVRLPDEDFIVVLGKKEE